MTEIKKSYYAIIGDCEQSMMKGASNMATKDYVDKLSKNKISAASLNNFCVYALWDKDEIVYVGQSTQLGQRIIAHTKNKSFDSYSFFDCKSFYEMDSIESALIIQLKPKYNVQYGNGYESLAKLRKRIRKVSDKHKYNPKYYVREIRKRLSDTDIEMIEFKGSTVIKTQDVPKALEYILEEIMSKESNRGSMDGVMSKGYGTIPKLVMQHEDLSIEAKAIYAYLASFAGAGDTAYPSVSIMCKHLGISKDRFYRHRKSLLDNDFIRITQHQNEGGWSNNLYTVVSMPSPQNKDTQNKDTQNKGTQNKDTRNKDTINNSSINNSSINNSINNNSIKDSPAKAEPPIPYKEIIEHLNLATNSNYRHTTKSTQNLIKARFNEGFTLDDFKEAIDAKANEWLNDQKMAKYLRPQTLFGTKFESYLNQSTVQPKQLGHTADAPTESSEVKYDDDELEYANNLIEKGVKQFNSLNAEEQKQLNAWRNRNAKPLLERA